MEQLTETHINNLRKLSDYLIAGSLKKKFSMSEYCVDVHSYHSYCEPEKHSCGTVACALGQGPDAGIDATGFYDWLIYAKKSFGVESGTKAYDFMYSWAWCDVDDTATGAGHRIKLFLEKYHGDVLEFSNEKFYFDDYKEGWWKQ